MAKIAANKGDLDCLSGLRGTCLRALHRVRLTGLRFRPS